MVFILTIFTILSLFNDLEFVKDKSYTSYFFINNFLFIFFIVVPLHSFFNHKH